LLLLLLLLQPSFSFSISSCSCCCCCWTCFNNGNAKLSWTRPQGMPGKLTMSPTVSLSVFVSIWKTCWWFVWRWCWSSCRFEKNRGVLHTKHNSVDNFIWNNKNDF
jgi:hypothetical protein